MAFFIYFLEHIKTKYFNNTNLFNLVYGKLA